jgi:BASS family bile acid:Na+ symporter
MLEALKEIDHIVLNFNESGRHMLNFTIAFIMFGVALELEFKDFIELFKKPKPALVGIISQFLLMPFLTFLLAISISDFITPTVGLGMILVAACPGGNVSNFMSSLAKGNIALSVSLTAFSSLGGIFLTPFNFAFWGNLYLSYLAMDGGSGMIPNLHVDSFEVLQTILIILGLPLVLGMLVNAKFPQFTAKVIKSLKMFSIVAFVGILLVIFISNYKTFTAYIQYIFLIVLVHNALALCTGYLSGKVARLKLQDRKTLSIETGIQNTALALALLFNPSIFPQDQALGGMAFIAAWYGVWHIISGLLVAGYWSGFSLSAKSKEMSPVGSG